MRTPIRPERNVPAMACVLLMALLDWQLTAPNDLAKTTWRLGLDRMDVPVGRPVMTCAAMFCQSGSLAHTGPLTKEHSTTGARP